MTHEDLRSAVRTLELGDRRLQGSLFNFASFPHIALRRIRSRATVPLPD